MNTVTRTMAKGLCAGVLTWGAFAMAATPENFKNTLDRDDYEMGLFRDDANPAAICEYGTQNRRYPSPARACRAAYETAMKSRTYNQATRYATLGCEAFHDRGLCQAMPKIPFPAAQDRTTQK